MTGQIRNMDADIAASLAAHSVTLRNIVREMLFTTDMDRLLSKGMTVRAEAVAEHALPATTP